MKKRYDHRYYAFRARAKTAGIPFHLTWEDWRALVRKHETEPCTICGRCLAPFRRIRPFLVDQAQGYRLDNLYLVCGNCARAWHGMGLGADAAEITSVDTFLADLAASLRPRQGPHRARTDAESSNP